MQNSVTPGPGRSTAQTGVRQALGTQAPGEVTGLRTVGEAHTPSSLRACGLSLSFMIKTGGR